VSLGAGVQLPAFPSSSPALLAKGLSSPQTSLGMKPGLVLSGRGVETKNGGADIERLVGESKFSAMARQSRDKNEVSQSAGRKIEWVGKRYFLWRVAEWAFDKVMVFLQVSVALALWTVDKLKRETQLESKLEDLRYPTYKSPKEVPSLFSKNEKVVSSPPASLPAAAVSSSDITTTSGAGEGTSERKYSTPSISTSLSTEVKIKDTSLTNFRSAASIALITAPMILLAASFCVEDKNLDMFAQAATWLSASFLFVDLMSGSAGGFTTLIRKSMPLPVRRVLAYPRPLLYDD